MSVTAYFRSIANKFWGRSKTGSDLDQELRSHMQLRADDLERGGLKRAEAERRARIEFGGHVRFQEECREELGGIFFETVFQDVRLALRVLRKSPGFAVAAILTLTLAIGANSVVFGVMDGLILRTLNVPQTGTLWGTEYGQSPGWQSYPNYVDLRDRNRSFESLAAFNFVFAGLDTGNNPSVASGFATSGNYFDVLRLQPYLGRFFHGADEHGPNSAPYLVLTYAYWHSHFQDDRSIVGRIVQLNKHPFTVIGVGPPGFVGTILFVSPDFFIPIVNQDQVDGDNLLNARESTRGIFEVLGHLKPGVTHAQAVADVNGVGSYLEKTYPKSFPHQTSTLIHEGLTAFASPARAFVAGLMLLAGLILLAACANLGSLFAAHAADRSREVALRLALGSGRGRILRQLLTEAFLVSLAGGALGLLASQFLLVRLSTWQPFAGAPVHLPVTPDAKLYLVALALALVSGLLFGIVPVRQVLRTDPYELIKSGSRTTGGRRITARDLLLVVQIAICGVLVTSSLVAVRGLARSLHGDFGFDSRNTMLAGTNLAIAGYSAADLPAMQRRMIQAMYTIPGVEHAGIVNDYPPLVYTAGTRENVFRNETTDLRQSNVAALPYRYEISPGYLAAAGTVLLAGRGFTWIDAKSAPFVAVVNQDLATKMFGSVAGAVGRHYKLQDGRPVQVVGVVENGKYQNVNESGQPAMFLSCLQSPSAKTYLIVRSGRDPQSLAAAMRSKFRELDRGLPVDTQTWSSLLSVVLFPARIATVALGVLGLMGAMLSVTGIFGMAAYSVSRRLKELGIRIALGAQSREVLQAALGRALKLLAFGSAAGLFLGILASRVLAFIVYQATSRDPVVLGGVILAMLLLGLLATWIPAQRALSLDPLTLLRED